METYLIYRNREIPVEPGILLVQALDELELSPEMIIALRAGRLMMADEVIKEGDQIKLISVISGGKYR